MADDGWRTEVENNRLAMFADDLWGVPSFRFGQLSTWGQDRLWLVEKAVAETLAGPRKAATRTSPRTPS
jgi:2-hydroxychromene-2-carboxylate isomerase